MKLERVEPPREFRPGPGVTIRDCARIELEPGEQVTFVGAGEHDVARTSWGYYATASLNGRLSEHELRGVLALGRGGRMYVLLVHAGAEDDFSAYAEAEGMRVLAWLDDDEAVADLVRRLEA